MHETSQPFLDALESAKRVGLIDALSRAIDAVDIKYRGQEIKSIVGLTVEKETDGFQKGWYFVRLNTQTEAGQNYSTRYRFYLDQEGKFERFSDFAVSLNDAQRSVLQGMIDRL